MEEEASVKALSLDVIHRRPRIDARLTAWGRSAISATERATWPRLAHPRCCNKCRTAGSGGQPGIALPASRPTGMVHRLSAGAFQSAVMVESKARNQPLKFQIRLAQFRSQEAGQGESCFVSFASPELTHSPRCSPKVSRRSDRCPRPKPGEECYSRSPEAG